VYVTLLPTLLVLNQTISGSAFMWLDSLGLSVFLLGFGLETAADTQKFKFKMNAENEGKFITEGVWAVSRHPNYFGEMVLWWGVYLVCLPNLNLAQSLVGLLSPLTVTALISFLSGIPPLERSAQKKWGALQSYQDYKKTTPVLIPFVHTRCLEYQKEESGASGAETLEEPLNQ
jgi:steroid 5-alpha reductase family enzyme